MKLGGNKKLSKKALLEELEPRLLLSADLAAGLTDHASEDDASPLQVAPLLTESESASADTTGAEQHRRELVIIDVDTPDYSTLLDDLRNQESASRSFEVVMLGLPSSRIARSSRRQRGP